MQPSYKVGMFFETPWWTKATYAPKLTGYVVTADVVAQLGKRRLSAKLPPDSGEDRGNALPGRGDP